MALLAKAERKLRAGKVSEAMNLFEEIVDGYMPSLERLAALAHLRTSERKPPRRGRQLVRSNLRCKEETQ